MPLVSSIIVFLNGEPFIDEAIQSVFAQSYAHWELLLVDDGSTDGSSEVARRYSERYPARVQYLEHEGHQNRGMSAARNLGIRHARGEYLAFLDADDVWLPHKLQQQVALLASEPEAAMVYGMTQYWYSWTGRPEDSQRDFTVELGVTPNTLVRPPELFFLSLQSRPPVPMPSVIMVRRTAVEQVGGFVEKFRIMFEDQAFLAKVYLHQSVYMAGQCWTRYRQHSNSAVEVTLRTPGQFEADRLMFLNWLTAYCAEQNLNTPEIQLALRQALWPHRHPLLHRISQQIRDLRRSTIFAWTRSLASGRAMVARRGIGTLTAQPNPVIFSGRFAVGMTTLSWEVMPGTPVEVHVNAPHGPLVSRSNGAGSTSTGAWVTDGMVFYLQDVSGGLSLTLANTLAVTRVRVVAASTPRTGLRGQNSP